MYVYIYTDICIHTAGLLEDPNTNPQASTCHICMHLCVHACMHVCMWNPKRAPKSRTLVDS